MSDEAISLLDCFGYASQRPFSSDCHTLAKVWVYNDKLVLLSVVCFLFSEFVCKNYQRNADYSRAYNLEER